MIYMKNYIRVLTMITALMFGAVSGAWAQLNVSDIEIENKPNASAGNIEPSVNGREVTLTVTPAAGYYIKASDFVVEKLVNTGNANAPKRRVSDITNLITGKLYSGSGRAETDIISSVSYPNSAQYVFTLPADYDGAYVTATFTSLTSGEVIRITRSTSLGSTPDMNAHYILVDDVSAAVLANLYSATPFTGIFEGEPKADGSFPTISGLTHALFQTVNGGTVKNIVLDNVTIAGSTYYTSVTVSNQSKKATGAIANVATGTARIYNCGIQATGSSVTTDKDGYTLFSTVLDAEKKPQHTESSSTVGGVDYVGGLVGFLDGTARVINCYSYADVTSGSIVGGIVGRNNVATTASNLNTMVMNCMFYGNLASGDKAPIYNGVIITNRSDQSGVSNFNYFWAGAPYVQNQSINTYNCALTAETRYLQRFEFFRHLLNGHRELAAWWVQGDDFKKDEMAKWVMEPSQIGTTTPYPILKSQGKYPSVVNYEPSDETIDANNEHYNEGRKLGTLSVTIRMGTNSPFDAPAGARLKSGQSMTLTLPITDKDPAHFNFNYGKVQLPYYNDYGIGNYTGNRVVTGWKIVSISGGTKGSYSSSSSDATASVNDDGDITLTTPYNFADRKCTDKDLFGESGRIFNQGAYFDVPEGVTSITIEPYWGKCVYVSDQFPDVVYNQGMSTAANVTTVGGGSRFTDGGTYYITDDNTQAKQAVYTSMTSAVTALNPSGTVYDNAIVLVGNVHNLDISNKEKTKPYTIMSIDLDKDNEPDYSYILRFNSRVRVHPVRVDFLNIPGLGMAQKSTGGTGTYNFGIMQTYGWFESTNTSLFRVTQFEYDYVNSNSSGSKREDSPMILQGGVIEQWVTVGGAEDNHKEAESVTYYHVGGNVWFKEFHIGVHQDKNNSNNKDQFVSKHPPISVTGGDYNEFYLTGLYNTPSNNYDDNAECYINGGRFNKVAGTGMQGIGNLSTHENGNITWQIDNADINEFYGGGINAAHISEGNIMTVISNSRVDQFCGGPKFGDMNHDKKVVTNARNCTFRAFFGAGYGGNSYNRRYPDNQNGVTNINWDTWVQGNNGLKYRYDSNYGGVETRIDYQFIPQSSNTSNVARLFVDYVSFSLATTHDVTSKLTDCTITTQPLGSLELFSQSVGNFYGGGNLGMVDGPVKSTLTNCTVEGNVFGGGYSATLPTVAVMNNSFQTAPHYDSNLGAYLDAELPTTVAYTWQHRDEVNSTETAINTNDHILYTQENLTELGAVTGNVTLTIDGNTTLTNGKRMSVAKSVYGGGEESNVEGNTQVNITGGTITENVYGGGKGEADEFSCSKAMIGVNNTGAGADLTTDENKNKGTKVTISNGQVNGNVYGGGEVGRVEWNTQVTIGAGEGTPIINGSVFGAGAGVATHGYAALVRGNSTVTVQGNAKVLQNVYGGGEQATVGRYWVKGVNDNVTGAPTAPTDTPDEMPYQTMSGGKCTVTIQGSAKIGPESGAASETTGHVFGAGKGVTPNYNNTQNDNNRSKRMVDYSATKHTGTPGTTWDYYEAYTEAQIADTNFKKYVWEYFVDDADPTAANYKTGEDKYLEFLQTLALVTGTDVTINGATVKGNVYGGSENGFVQDDTDVKIQAGTIGTSGTTTYGNVFGGGKGLAAFAEAGNVKGNTEVAISGGTAYGNVYGGGAYGVVKENVTVNVTGGEVKKDVYGGGALANTNTDNWDATANSGAGGWATGMYTAATTTTPAYTNYKTVVNVLGGIIGTTETDANGNLVNGRVFGGGLGDANTPAYVYGDVKVNLNGLEASDYVEAAHSNYVQLVVGSGTSTTDHYELKTTTTGEAPNTTTTYATGAIVNSVFAANNLNGTPKGNATLHVFATQNRDGEHNKINQKYPIPSETNNVTASVYDVKAVYGGGNLANYVPVYDQSTGVTAFKTQVIIEGCSLTSIETVYGGGNAAAVPETNVTVKSTYEIGYVFGGGDGHGAGNPGADVGTPDHGTTIYGTGNANTLLEGGVIHEVYGGSNQKGIIKGSLNQTTNPKNPTDPDCCELIMDKVVGAGKYADIDGDVNMTLSCQPSKKVALLFAGADEANVNGNITLNITNGTFGQVFGGNNLSGAVKGKITVNVEETGCQPIKIDELYLGGNEAAYSRFGYYIETNETKENGTGTSDPNNEQAELDGGRLVFKPRTSATDTHKAVKTYNRNDNSWTVYAGDEGDPAPTYDNPVLNIISCTSIGKVFGGGYGGGAIMYADPTVNINQIYGLDNTDYTKAATTLGEIGDVYGGGNEAQIVGNTTVNICTLTEVDPITTPVNQTANANGKYDVVGANIIGNVFGAGKGVATDVTKALVSGNSTIVMKGGSVKKSVYGGGELAQVEGNTYVTVMGGTIGTAKADLPSGVTMGAVYGNIYGGGQGNTANSAAGLIKGNTNVTVANSIVGENTITPTILHNIYGGGAYGSVGNFTFTTGVPSAYDSGGTANVTITGGTIGTDGHENGMVFGSSRGDVAKPVAPSEGADPVDPNDKLAWVYDANVIIGTSGATTGPQINGSVYGSGENGHTYRNTDVKIYSGTIGINSSDNVTIYDLFDNTKKVYEGKAYNYPYRGNVYGGGCGTDMYDSDANGTDDMYNPLAGIVRGAATVTITGGQVVHNVYGAGAMGSVGKTTKDGNDIVISSGGTTTIEISGGIVGGDGDGNGNVFGAARGDSISTQAGIALVKTTNVIISGDAAIKGNVYGGGQAGDVGTYHTVTEEGLNKGNNNYLGGDASGVCNVVVTGGTIGSEGTTNAGHVFGAGKGAANTYTCQKAMVKKTSVTISNGTIYGDVYGGGEVGRVEQDATVSIGTGTGSGTFAPTIHGNVFGAGAGLETHGYSALVRGNSNVTIGGSAAVRKNVYGGGKAATVGKYWVSHFSEDPNEAPPAGFPDGMPYKTRDGGFCRVTIQGQATIGPASGDASEEAGQVFGAGKGVSPSYSAGVSKRMNDQGQWEYFDGATGLADYFQFLETLALASNTVVTVNGATVKASVFGGSESGFVQDHTTVTVNDGVIGTSTTPTYGNVFGGGKGLETFAEAGRVRGNTTVAFNGGRAYGSVYGGGKLGDVGTIDKTDIKNYKWIDRNGNYNNTGVCSVTISGGNVGPDNNSNTEKGNVFGAGKGVGDSFWCEKAMAYDTNVSIENGTVNGNVYGGGEVGRVENDTEVTVGRKTGEAAGAGTGTPVIKGSVFGAGKGLETHGYSALVRGNTTVTVEGGEDAIVENSVYGGGEIASVGRYGLDANEMPEVLVFGGTCIVNIQGSATIGSTTGNVFGAGKGVVPHFNNTGSDKTLMSRRMTLYTNGSDFPANAPTPKGSTWEYIRNYSSEEISNNAITKYVWEYFQDEDKYKTYLETLALATHPKVTISGGATVNGSVFGGGELGITKGSVVVNIQGGTITEDVYGGGSLANTNTTKDVAKRGENGKPLPPDPNGKYDTEEVHPTTTVNLQGGTMRHAYGGGLGRVANTTNNITPIEAKVYGDVTVKLNEGKSTDDTGAKVDRVFGANNLNGSPQKNVTVYVYATQNKAKAKIGIKNDKHPKNDLEADGAPTTTYDVIAVYGGGNEAAYIPETAYTETTSTGSKTQVLIEGCQETSIKTVYGGGNAASVPESNVTILSAYEIERVFGGGNGKDATSYGENPGADIGVYKNASNEDVRYGTGNANTDAQGGYIHELYGASNEKGTIKGNISLKTEQKGTCPLLFDRIYNAGKNADVEGDMIAVLGCQPNEKIPEYYGGAENANVKGNVELTITSGNFGKIFAGNNKGGAIFGHIKLNIEETGCSPIIIDELYGCGNNAAYSVYGYYHASEDNDNQAYSDETHATPLYKKQNATDHLYYLYWDDKFERPFFRPRTSADDTHAAVSFNGLPHTAINPDTKQYENPEINIISATRIGKVFGGGLGSGAVVYGNPTVNINQIYGTPNGTTATALGRIGVDANGSSADCGVFGGGNAADVIGNTTVNIGTATAVRLHESWTAAAGYKMSDDEKTVLGANILSNVYGGGNLANVTGNTFVNVCAVKSGDSYAAVAEGAAKVNIAGNVYGGGKGLADNFLCDKAMIGTDGAGVNADFSDNTNYKDGNTSVIIGNGTVGTLDANNKLVEGTGNVYGGGEIGRVEKNTAVTIGIGNGDDNKTSAPIVRGDVFGGGKGDKEHGYAALVRGNPTVIVQGDAKVGHSVYGAGEIASVARYRVPRTPKEVADAIAAGYTDAVLDMPYALANPTSGYCTVKVQGNAEIGPDNMKMVHPEITDGTDKPDDAGHVFAAGKGFLPENYPYDKEEDGHMPKRMINDNGIDKWEWFHNREDYIKFIQTLALSSNTEVTIDGNAFVKGSVYGGSENGLVQYDTKVYIKGGQIGNGDGVNRRYSDAEWAYDGSNDTKSLAECASWPYEAPYAPYDPNANATGDLDKYSSGKSTEGGRRLASDGHTYYGNVFGGGSGSVPYFDTDEGISKYLNSAGTVKGNTHVEISGGHILTSVYGGCEATNVQDTAYVTMTGGTVGVPRTLNQINNHPVTCYVFGGGKGDQRIFFNKDTNVGNSVVDIQGGRIYGSVFGGGEDGHVMRNVALTIGNDDGTGPTIGTWGTSYVEGNVFGGGRGFGGEALTAGNIGGSVTMNIKGGTMLGSIYGGGRLGSVGYGLYLVDEVVGEEKPYSVLRPDGVDDNGNPVEGFKRGYITINISGGTIGNEHEYKYYAPDVELTSDMKTAANIPNTTFDYQNHLLYTKGGNVFTGCMGRLYALDGSTLLPLWPKLGKCKETVLNITGGTIKSSVYGGGEIGAVQQNTTVNVTGGTVGTKVVDSEDETKYYYFGSVFGGGKGSTDAISYPAGTAEADKVDISEAGTVGGNVLVELNKGVAEDKPGGIVNQVFGCNDMNGSPKGMVDVHIYATQTVGKSDISTKLGKELGKYDVQAVYGGGNLAAYKPQGPNVTPTDYDYANTTHFAKVIIDGCGRTSIGQVYGGGNAASTPATEVTVNGTYEIGELFGGGNGKDDVTINGVTKPNPGANVGYYNYSQYVEKDGKTVVEDMPAYDTKEKRLNSDIQYGTGKAAVNIFGGTIHRVFGGSNTKGNVRQSAITLLEEAGGCDFCVDEAYGGGKSAPMDAEAKLLMACIPGLKAVYGGAQAADVYDDVTLTITNGNFDRVFGGNNISGTIRGRIQVNIEETGCKPVIIGELYGGGNQAGYSVYGYNADGSLITSGDTPLYADPEVNVKSFTSIGNIYGGGYGTTATMVGNPIVNINEGEDATTDAQKHATAEYAEKAITLEANTENEHQVTLPKHTQGKMGAINNVFGGGNAAEVIGNTNVNIGTQTEGYMTVSDTDITVGTTDVSNFYTRTGTTTATYVYTQASGTAQDGVTYYKKYNVKGADIRGNVYGGGNNAQVTGNTNVNIGKKEGN